MEVSTRPVCDQDRDQCIWIEAGATPNLSYINDTWEMFTTTEGDELIASLYGDQVGGFGQFSRLYRHFGWLEALRVHPEFQGKGLGKAIYKRYMEKMVEENITAVGMYTGSTNAVSKGLAELFGLALQGHFYEFTAATKSDGTSVSDFTFAQVESGAGEAVLAPHYEEMGDFIVVNRTFIPVSAGLGAYCASNGWLWQDDTGALLIAGARFQPQKALHFAYTYGDFDRLLAFAHALASQRGSAGITAMRPVEQVQAHEELLGNDFAQVSGEFITLWLSPL